MKIFSSQLWPGLLVTLTLSSCQFISGDRVVGNLQTQRTTRQIGSFTQLDVAASVQVYLTQGAVTDAVIEGESNIIPELKTEIRGDKLVIKYPDGLNIENHQPVKIYLSTPDISKIDLLGSGLVSGQNVWSSSGNFNINLLGSGRIHMQLNCPEVISRIVGSGDVEASGETRNEQVKIMGSGNFLGENLKAEQVNADMEGSGNASVFASVDLTIKILGSGNIHYSGDPALHSKILGSGVIIKNK